MHESKGDKFKLFHLTNDKTEKEGTLTFSNMTASSREKVWIETRE